MAVFKLTNLERMKLFLQLSTSDTKKPAEIARWIPQVSARIQRHLKRWLQKGQHTQYLDPMPGKRDYRLWAYPVDSITGASYDQDALYNGTSETDLTSIDYLISANKKDIIFDTTYNTAPKGIRVSSVGGMASNGINNTFSLAGAAGVWTAGKYLYGALSAAVGKIVSATDPTWTDSDNLVMKHRFNYGSGATATDDEGTYDGTITTATWATSDTDYGNCIEFSGGTDNVDFDDVTELNSAAAFTIGFYFNYNSISATGQILRKGPYDVSPDDHLGIDLLAGYGRLRLVGSVSSTSFTAHFDYDAEFDAGDWHKVIIVFDGSGTLDADKVKMYVDGTSKTLTFTGTVPSALGDMATDKLHIGCQTNAISKIAIDGKIDNLMIWSTSLTAAQALAWCSVADSTKIVCTNLIGTFDEAETLTEYTTIDAFGNLTTATSGTTGTLTSIGSPSLAQLYPSITMACEWAIRLLIDRKYNIEKIFQSRDKTEWAASSAERKAAFNEPDIVDMLAPYVNRDPHAIGFTEEVN